MRVIILAAGQGFKLDGFTKLLIKDPKSGETLLEKYLKLFPSDEYKITIVVGYNAITIMNEYPDLDYVYNDQWRITENSYSLALALNDEPCIVMSSDLVFDEEVAKLIREAPENSVLVKYSENKGFSTVRCKVGDKSIVKLLYLEEQYNQDPETVGIFKISDKNILREWKKNCMINKHVFSGINLPLGEIEVKAVDIGNRFFHEVNTHLDFLNLIKRLKEK